MSLFRFADPTWLALLGALPLIALLGVWATSRRRRASLRFADRSMHALLGWYRPGLRGVLRGLMTMAALGALAIALARPQTDPEEQLVRRSGRDIVFLLDVSKSMLATDLAPTRLDRAKLWIRDLVSTLEGDRVGLVVFAGTPVVRCPLTLDYSFFRLSLEEASPLSVTKGGTMIGDAIRETLDRVLPDDTRHRDLILITDGEDQESFPVEAATLARERGVRIIAIGVGSEDSGARVPIIDDEGKSVGFATQGGRTVVSKLDASQLASIATASKDGVYLNVGTGALDLEQVYRDLIASAARSSFESETRVSYTERFQWFVGLALAFLCLEALIGGRRA